ncbi:hypothetical protein DL767_005928 [Monosporascus sp. MG133]|nr:hypothetical protein DL767_005928 [Monosporascus sp. MG133]
MATTKPRFNIAVCLRGDVRDEKDQPHQFLPSTVRVVTDDHTETVLVNAAKDTLQDPATPGFAFNRISSPEGSFLRVDASVWIGTPDAPMGWDVSSIRQGWHPD